MLSLALRKAGSPAKVQGSVQGVRECLPHLGPQQTATPARTVCTQQQQTMYTIYRVDTNQLSVLLTASTARNFADLS